MGNNTIFNFVAFQSLIRGESKQAALDFFEIFLYIGDCGFRHFSTIAYQF